MHFVRWDEDGTSIRGRLRGLAARLGWRRRPQWQPSPELMANWEAIGAIPASPLVQVVGVGRTADAAGITVELLAIEVREEGAIVHWRARSASYPMLLSADVSISDNTGTAYRVISGGGGGGGGAWEGTTFVQPSPPPGARLRITLLSFGPDDDRPLLPGLPTERVFGPWAFDVEMP
jgi:hypothetical protein